MKTLDVIKILTLTLFLASCSIESKSQVNPSSYKVWKSEIEIFPNNFKGAFSYFRIPSISNVNDKMIFAFCEGRKKLEDYGDTDILFKVSRDGGINWENPYKGDNSHKILFGLEEIKDIEKTANWRNPTSVFTGEEVYLFVAVDQGGEKQSDIQSGKAQFETRFFFIKTTNDPTQWGKKILWSKPEEIQICHRHRWGAFGPGSALYHNGTIIVPMNTNYGGTEKRSFCMYSEDNGKTWQKTQDTGSSTENQVAISREGKLIMSKRKCYDQDFFEAQNLSSKWIHKKYETNIKTAKSQTGFAINKSGRVFISGPSKPLDCDKPSTQRNSIGLWWTDELSETKNWSGPLYLEESGPPIKDTHGYSCIAFWKNEIIIAYEDSKKGEPYKRIVISKVK